jgi:hypothetical protein
MTDDTDNFGVKIQGSTNLIKFRDPDTIIIVKIA